MKFNEVLIGGYMKKMILPIILVLLLIGCSMPDEIGLPSWTLPIRLVLLNDTFDAEVIAEEVGALQANGDTLQFYDSITESQNFSDYEIEDTDVHTTSFALSDFAPTVVEQYNGQPVTVIPNYPDFTIPIDIEKDLAIFDEFEQVMFIDANLNITITNNTIFWLGDIPEGEPLVVQVLDNNDNIIAEQEMDENIPPLGGSINRIISLADSLIGNDISVHLMGEGDVTDDSTAVIDLDATVILDAQITDIEAEYVINAQISSLSYDIIEGYQEVDLLHPEIVEADSFEITGNSSIVFTIESPIPILASFGLIAKRNTTEIPLVNFEGDPIQLDIEEGITQIEFSSDDYNINDMLQIIPSGFDYSMDPFIGNGTVIPYISFDDSVTVQLEIVGDIQIYTFEEDGIWIIPLDEGEISIVPRDTEAFEPRMFDAYNFGKIHFKYWNNTGMELGFDLLVSDDSSSIYTETFNFEDPDTTNIQIFRIPLLEETSENNYGEFELDILQRDLSYFISDSVYTLPRVHIYSDGEDPWTGGLRIQADLVIEIDISHDLINEEDE